MKLRGPFTFLFRRSILLTLGAAALMRAQDLPPPVTVAVYGFKSVYIARRQEVTDLVIGHLSGNPQLAVLDRGELDKALAEQLIGNSQDIGAAAAARFRLLSGAAVIVTGQLTRVQDNHCTVTARVVSTLTGRAYSKSATGRDQADIPKMVADLSRQIEATILDPDFDAGAVPTKTRDERIADILRNLGGGRRGAVLLRIDDARPGERLAGTTAEAELGYILQRAGFTVVDAESHQRPDFTVTGTVVCEGGAPQSGLFPSRADLAIKVRAEGTGAIVLLDRQSGDALSLGERTSADAATVDAADQLAARLLPQLLRQP